MTERPEPDADPALDLTEDEKRGTTDERFGTRGVFREADEETPAAPDGFNRR